MTSADLVVLGLNGRVAALSRQDGRLLWDAELPGILGERFVTVACDETRVYAYTRGQVHCLDIRSGRLLWSNELKGFGYGIATLCVPGAPVAPAPPAQVEAERRSRSASPPAR